MANTVTPDDVLSFWFGEAPRPRDEWFKRSDAFDNEIRVRFGEAIERAARGELDEWRSTPRGRLGLVIVLDQFSRNVFRDTPRAFTQDARALSLAQEGIDRGEPAGLSPVERNFAFMPLMHAEDRATQARGVALFEQLAREAPPELAGWLAMAADFARRHRDIVERFGRFPHRNRILGRESTPEEVEFLKGPGSSF